MIKQTKQTIGELECVIARDPNVETPRAVVILCHGYGAPSTDLVPLARELMETNETLQESVFVFPAAPLELDPMFDARAWWPIDLEKIQQLMMDGQTREMRTESPELLPTRRKELTAVVDQCQEMFAVPASKIVIGGFSQGSMLSTDVALHYPQRLGGLIVWSGALINETDWTAQAKRQEKLEIVQSHGRIDPILPMSGGEDLRDMLTESGHHVRFCEFNGQHSIPMEAIDAAVQLITEVGSVEIA